MEFPKWLTWLGQTVWRWIRVIWVCRIPVASVLGGGLLLAATPQARDLFADLGIKPWQWVVFLIFVFLWAWIAHGEQPGAWALAGGTLIIASTAIKTVLEAREERGQRLDAPATG